jgi:plasmid stabilization system protein ParE
MAHRVAPEAESDLGEICYYIARESSSAVIADRIIDLITERFFLLGRHPHLGRRRNKDLRPGLRSFLMGEYIYPADGDDVFVLPVVRGSREIEGLLNR